MNDRSILWIHLILAIGLPSGILLYSIAAGTSIESMLLNVIIAFCVIPIVAFGMYMWVSGRGQMWINGVNWKALDEYQSKRAVRLMGLSMAVFGIGLYLSFMFIAESLTIFILLIVILIVGLLVFLVYVNTKKFRSRPAKEPKMSQSTMLAVSMIVIFASVIPAFMMTDVFGDGNINVNVTDDYVSVEGPMFKYREFNYDEIDECWLDKNFEKGKRINGYGTSNIKSGHFENSSFGRYMLASYAKVTPCIVISMDGEIYAFNQSTVEETQDVYDKLSIILGPKAKP